MKKTAALLVALSALLPFTASAAPDVIGALDMKYQYDEDKDSRLLKDYDGEPWWVILANCAGYYIASSETADVPEDAAQSMKKQANFYATVASFRLSKDRAWPEEIHEMVTNLAYRNADNALQQGIVSTPARRQSVHLLCGAQLNAYERMVPGMELN